MLATGKMYDGKDDRPDTGSQRRRTAKIHIRTVQIRNTGTV
jgi:hypothetical protein